MGGRGQVGGAAAPLMRQHTPDTPTEDMPDEPDEERFSVELVGTTVLHEGAP